MAWFVVFLALNAGCQAFRTEDSQQRLRNASGEVPKMVLDHEHPWRNHEDSMHAQSSGQRASHQRIELFQDEKENPSAKEILLAVGGGTGAGTGGSIEMDREIIRRMRYQDKLVLALMVAVYFVAIIFTASLAYRAACNNSSVKFYADPRVEPLMIDSDDMDDFLVTFMQPPKSIQLSVQGLMPIPALLANLVEGAIEWQGGYYRHIFSFSLDLSHFLVPSGLPEDGSDTAMAGLADQDLEELRRFLAENTNDLATVSMMKEVSWDDWEELANNIKQKIRQGGFEGLIHVSWKNSEMLTVLKVLSQPGVLPSNFLPVVKPYVALLYPRGHLPEHRAASRCGMTLLQFRIAKQALEKLQGKQVAVKMTEFIIEENVACAVVELPKGVPCAGQIPHLTLGTRENVPAQHACDVLEEILSQGRTEGITRIKLPKAKELLGVLDIETYDSYAGRK